MSRRPLVIIASLFAVLAVSVPLQYLVRREVVVGMEAGAAHSHAHGEEGHTHAGEDAEEGEGEHEHPEEEGHLATEVPLGVNLIPNYGFEAGTREQIWGWMSVGTDEGETAYRDDGVARSGLASAAVTTNGKVVGYAGWAMPLYELPLDHVVAVEGYVRTEGVVGAAYLKLTLEAREEGSGKQLVLDWAYSEGVAGDGGWFHCSAGIYVPAECTRVWLEAGIQGQGKAWFDDVSLVVEEPER